MSIKLEDLFPGLKTIGINTAKTITMTGAAGLDMSGSTGVIKTPSGVFTITNGGTIPTGKTLAVTDADKLTIGGLIVPQKIELSFEIKPFATVTEYDLWVATAAYQVTAIKAVPSTVQGGALTATICKATGATAPVKTTTPMHAADALDFNATAYTVQTPSLTATTADLQLAAGDRIGIDFSAALTAGHGVVSITLKRI
jgi:hypothetical protein